MWPWGIFSQIFTPKFWKSVKADGLIQTYQRGHKAVMNTHTVGGNNLQRTKYVGMDQYGNKYYEDFDPLRKQASNQISTRRDGSSIMTIFLSVVPMVTWFLPNGTAGSLISTTKCQYPKVRLSRTPSSSVLTNGTFPTVPPKYTFLA